VWAFLDDLGARIVNMNAVLRRVIRVRTLQGIAGLCVTVTAGLSGQTREPPRRLSAAQTGCDTIQAMPTDSVYQFDAVDQPVKAERVPIQDLPLKMGEVLSGRSVFRFIIEPSGRINRCSIELIEEDAPPWTDEVLKELRWARYRPARRGGQKVRQWVYQVFTYNQDGRFRH